MPDTSRECRGTEKMNTNTLVPEGRMPELGGIRGFAIFLVLIWHYLQWQIAS